VKTTKELCVELSFLHSGPWLLPLLGLITKVQADFL